MRIVKWLLVIGGLLLLVMVAFWVISRGLGAIGLRTQISTSAEVTRAVSSITPQIAATPELIPWWQSVLWIVGAIVGSCFGFVLLGALFVIVVLYLIGVLPMRQQAPNGGMSASTAGAANTGPTFGPRSSRALASIALTLLGIVALFLLGFLPPPPHIDLATWRTIVQVGTVALFVIATVNLWRRSTDTDFGWNLARWLMTIAISAVCLWMIFHPQGIRGQFGFPSTTGTASAAPIATTVRKEVTLIERAADAVRAGNDRLMVIDAPATDWSPWFTIPRGVNFVVNSHQETEFENLEGKKIIDGPKLVVNWGHNLGIEARTLRARSLTGSPGTVEITQERKDELRKK